MLSPVNAIYMGVAVANVLTFAAICVTGEGSIGFRLGGLAILTGVCVAFGLVKP